MVTAEHYAELKERGICPHCAKRPCIPGKAICKKCRSSTYPSMYTARKAQYEERKASGLCTRCGKNRPIDGELQCVTCKQYLAERRANYTPEQKHQHAKVTRQWAENNRQRRRDNDKRRRDKIREEAIGHYGGRCVCCGETESKFLTLDHINSGGNQHRLELLGRKTGGTAFYRKIKALGYPNYIQVLCWNCNMAKAFYGSCPHHPPADTNTACNIASRAACKPAVLPGCAVNRVAPGESSPL